MIYSKERAVLAIEYITSCLYITFVYKLVWAIVVNSILAYYNVKCIKQFRPLYNKVLDKRKNSLMP